MQDLIDMYNKLPTDVEIGLRLITNMPERSIETQEQVDEMNARQRPGARKWQVGDKYFKLSRHLPY